LAERRQEAFLRKHLESTQQASDVLRRRIRELREAKGLRQRALAEALTNAGVPMTGDKLCKIEKGVREVRYDELLAFAQVLDVPLQRLMRPADGELPIRAGSLRLGGDEVANWIVWGPPWTEDSKAAQTLMRLVMEISRARQIAEDELDPVKRCKLNKVVVAFFEDLWRASGISPGVLDREKLRAEMDAALVAGETEIAGVPSSGT